MKKKNCDTKGRGGLWSKIWKFFNYSLIEKWLWRYLDDNNYLWAIVISSNYGLVEAKRKCLMSIRGSSSRSCWWKDVVEVQTGSKGQWFLGNLELKVGDGVR